MQWTRNVYQTLLLVKILILESTIPTFSRLVFVFRTNTQVFLGNENANRPPWIKVCCWIWVNNVLIFCSHCSPQYMFVIHWSAARSPEQDVRLQHIPSTKETHARALYRHAISKWKCKKRKTNTCGKQAQILYLQSISIPYMERIPLSQYCVSTPPGVNLILVPCHADPAAL